MNTPSRPHDIPIPEETTHTQTHTLLTPVSEVFTMGRASEDRSEYTPVTHGRATGNFDIPFVETNTPAENNILVGVAQLERGELKLEENAVRAKYWKESGGDELEGTSYAAPLKTDEEEAAGDTVCRTELEIIKRKQEDIESADAPQLSEVATTVNSRNESDEMERWSGDVNTMPDRTLLARAIGTMRDVSIPGAWPVDNPFGVFPAQHQQPMNTSLSMDFIEEVGAADGSAIDLPPFEAQLAPSQSSLRSRARDNGRRDGLAASAGTTFLLVEAKPDPEAANQTRQASFVFVIVVIMVLIIVLMILGIVGVFDGIEEDSFSPNENSTSQVGDSATLVPTPPKSSSFNRTKISIMNQIRESGVLDCAYYHVPGVMDRDPQTGEVTGFHSLQCRALAAALSTQEKSIRVNYSGFESVKPLDRHFQIKQYGVTHTMQRHVMESSFSRPTLFAVSKLAGQPFYVDCAVKKNFRQVDECRGLSVCVMNGTMHHAILQKKLPDRLFHLSETTTALMADFVAGKCNTLMWNPLSMSESEVRKSGYTGNYSMGDAVYAIMPGGVPTEKGDPEWADFVNAVMQALLVAEQYNISQANAHMMPEFMGFGEEYKHMFQNAIKAVGNLAEVYQAHLGQLLPRETLNMINNGTSALLYSPPLGVAATLEVVERPLGRTLQSILDRGVLRCGMERNSQIGLEDGPTNVTGINTDYCRGLAASLFGGDTQAVELVDLENSEDGYKKLAGREIDVVAGATWTLANDVQEPTTGLGFAFSQPFLYAAKDNVNLCLAVMQEDHDWLTFTYWVVAATIYAEEQGIKQANHNLMPLIGLYGPGLERMFRDIVFAIGSYEEIYMRHFHNVRRGINALNNGLYPGPHLYPMPGFFA